MHYIELHLGPMFSGKTSHLNQLASRTLAVGHSVELWLPILSDEGISNAQKSKDISFIPKNVIVRHLKDHQINIDYLRSLHKKLSHCVDIVLIDEIHFFQHENLVNLFLSDIDTDYPYARAEFHCFGLNGTYQLTPWSTISELVPLASKITHYQANCSQCGYKVKAGFSHLKKKIIAKNTLKIEGGSDLYEALCHKCMAKFLPQV